MVRLLRTTIGSDPLRIQLLITNMRLGDCFLLRILFLLNFLSSRNRAPKLIMKTSGGAVRQLRPDFYGVVQLCKL